MIPESRIDIYNYIYNLLYGVVTENVYPMYVPTELTESDTTDGFVVISVGDVNDESEFMLEAYGQVRVFVTAYVPPMSRGRLDRTRYKDFEDKINSVIRQEIQYGSNEHYSIQTESVLSMDTKQDSNANNEYYMYVKSFIVTIE